MVETVRLQEHIFTGKTQIRALHEIVLITRVFQDIAQTDVLREEAGDRGGGVAFKGGKQRYAALRSHHARNRVIRSWQLLRVAEIQAFIFQRAQFRREIRESFVIKIGSLETFAIDINQVEFRVRDSFRRLFIISRKVRVAVA